MIQSEKNNVNIWYLLFALHFCLSIAYDVHTHITRTWICLAWHHTDGDGGKNKYVHTRRSGANCCWSSRKLFRWCREFIWFFSLVLLMLMMFLLTKLVHNSSISIRPTPKYFTTETIGTFYSEKVNQRIRCSCFHSIWSSQSYTSASGMSMPTK